jgi:hypothetical protein
VHLELNVMPSLAITDPPQSIIPVLIPLGRRAFWRADVSPIGLVWSGLVVDFDKFEWKHVECYGSVTHTGTGAQPAHSFQRYGHLLLSPTESLNPVGFFGDSSIAFRSSAGSRIRIPDIATSQS